MFGNEGYPPPPTTVNCLLNILSIFYFVFYILYFINGKKCPFNYPYPHCGPRVARILEFLELFPKILNL
jgi:hypothetical protein